MNIKDPIRINVFNDSSQQYIPRQRIITTLEQLLFDENVYEAIVNVIITDNDGIQKINNQHLGHDYPTDVLSFKMEEDSFEIEIYISIETVKDNSDDYDSNWREELIRCAIHGVLHEIGYDHSNEKDKAIMRKKEDKYLKIK